MTTQKFTRRHAVVTGLGAALVGGWGCATYLAADAAKKSGHSTHTTEGVLVLADNILAFGRADEALAKSMGKADVVAFLGAAHTYLLVEGGQALLSMAQLDPARLTLVSNSRSLFLSGKTVWGTLEFVYEADASNLSKQEETLLQSMGFVRNSPQTVRRQVPIQGAVYPAMDLKNGAFKAMQKPRPLEFRSPPSTARVPNVAAVAMLPVAIAIDILAAPVYLLGGVVVLLGAASR